MPGHRTADLNRPPLPKHLDQICDRFEAAWQAVRAGEPRPRLEDFLAGVAEPECPRLLQELLLLEVEYRRQRGETPWLEEYQQRFPVLPLEWLELIPQWIGRYRVERVLGQGSFGLVYLAYDDELDHRVAIKVPHRRLVSCPEDAELYLTEARTLAKLRHSNIVRVLDVGRTDEFLCYVVSEYIDGTDLATRLEKTRFSIPQTVELVATVAEALHHAHKQVRAHRDIKPANILLDKKDEPFVADFGLALREEDVGTGPNFAGTVPYMSPEQARAEGHRVDARSDVFSLGVVFYEMLTGQRPFQAESRSELLEQIINVEARPPRQLDDNIAKELDRICLKALSKRASDRYSTAIDMAEDLHHYLATARIEEPSNITEKEPGRVGLVQPVPEPITPIDSGLQAVKIVPKGLRSFDAADAYFFLQLLPGPRDRDELPDSIRFWKTQIEATDPDSTFSVGLIYGPSGCGKSSLVKAGLLPKLASSVMKVYMEATAEVTETRLLNSLRRQLPDLPRNLSLIESLAALRRGQFLESGQKILLVLDQFEQWLHGRRDEENAELVKALRHCDGARLQCIVMVRDDFWLAVSRFMQALEIRLVEGQNSRLVDLFDQRHARKVLTLFGKALGPLPDGNTTPDQDAFLKQAVDGLADKGGKVISVRLALFAEMVKGKNWTPATIPELGGMKGVGVTFLEETFKADTAPPQHKLHREAAQAVLKALLPDAGADLKGHMRSYDELLKESGYSTHPKDFDDLIYILNEEIRLIAPTDPEGLVGGGWRLAGEDSKRNGQPATHCPPPATRYYQLTHDYLVHSLRDWLTREQNERWRGRAELLLADRAAAWNARPENRQLPSLLQWVRIRCLTKKEKWTSPQRTMMRRATRYHGKRGFAATIILGLLGAIGWVGFGLMNAHNLLNRLQESTTTDAPAIIDKLRPYRLWANGLLREAYEKAKREGNAGRQLRASLALLPVDRDQVKYLQDRMLHGDPAEVEVIRKALANHKSHLTAGLWELLANPANDLDERFRAACALAEFNPDDDKWNHVRDDVAGMLAGQKPFEVARWTEVLNPVRKVLLPPLATYLEDDERTPADRERIGTVYGKYAADVPGAYEALETRLASLGAVHVPANKNLEFTMKQVNLCVGLLVMGRGDKVWPFLRLTPDPTLRSFLIERLGPGGVDARVVLNQLDIEQDTSIRRALLLALGQYGLDRLLQSERQNRLPRLFTLYGNDPDPGTHGAVGWLLKRWGQVQEVNRIDKATRVADVLGVKRGWSVTSEGQTMMVIPKPRGGEFWMGERASRHKEPLSHDFAMSSVTVTVDQFRRFCEEANREYKFTKKNLQEPINACPAIQVSWYDAAKYCNWLSKREGIHELQWCFTPMEDGKGMRLKANFQELKGYRLPTEAEWEYACRAGSEVSYSFGDNPEILKAYGWFDQNALGIAHPVGLLKPNDLGLFDMHGNVLQWCTDESKETASNRVVRGAAWLHPANFSRASRLDGDKPDATATYRGFRLAQVRVEGN